MRILYLFWAGSATPAPLFIRWKSSIEDDGLGFDPNTALAGGNSQSGWGIIGIQERVKLADGKVSIHSEPNKATRLVVKVPLVETGGGVGNATYKTGAG